MSPQSVACLDVFAPPVREIISGVADGCFAIRFADSYETDEQQGLATGADFILVGGARLPGAYIEANTRLRLIQKWGIGVDKIDLEAARRAKVPVAITAGANAGPVAELAIGLMLAVYRRIPFADRNLREGRWLKSEMRGWCHQIDGKTVGLLGFGAIARMVAHRLRGFDARIVYYDPNPADRATERALRAGSVSFDELLERSDILSVHTPLTERTRGLLDRAALARMKPGAILVNTARGGIVDEAALAEAVVSGHLAGAGVDAFAAEPVSPDNPLLGLDRVVLTPHAGGGVIDNVENVARHALGNMTKVLEGKPLAPADIVVSA